MTHRIVECEQIVGTFQLQLRCTAFYKKRTDKKRKVASYHHSEFKFILYWNGHFPNLHMYINTTLTILLSYNKCTCVIL